MYNLFSFGKSAKNSNYLKNDKKKDAWLRLNFLEMANKTQVRDRRQGKNFKSQNIQSNQKKLQTQRHRHFLLLFCLIPCLHE